MSPMVAERPGPPAPGEELRRETAHELVGALNAVAGFSLLLAADDGRLSQEQRSQYAQHVRDAASRLNRVALGVLGVDPNAVGEHPTGSGTHSISRTHHLPPAMDESPAHVSTIDERPSCTFKPWTSPWR